MRIGQNPAKFIDSVAQPAAVTATLVNCIPFLSGYYSQSLDVLKVCITSLRENTDLPFDLMVFDNHSCRDVRSYLRDAFEQGLIQYLVLSDTNIGKIGAWNFMFGAAQGEYVGFSDSDVYFRSGWLKASLDLFDIFPNVGMVTARPLRTQMELSTSTMEWVRQAGNAFEEGNLIDWGTFHEHESSLGHAEDVIAAEYQTRKDIRLTRGGKQAYVGAAHFQFLIRKQILTQVMPLPSEKPMRGENIIEVEINRLKYLRLCTDKPLVMHMGNRIIKGTSPAKPLVRGVPFYKRILPTRIVRNILLVAYKNIFRWLFKNVD